MWLFQGFTAIPLLFAGVAKLLLPSDGASILSDFALPVGTANVETGLAVAEILIGLWVLSGLGLPAAALTSLACYSAFAGVLAVELSRPVVRGAVAWDCSRVMAKCRPKPTAS